MNPITGEEAATLIKLIDRAAQLTRFGSFSERNPALGKMKTCLLCGRRERKTLHQCTAHLHTPIFVGQETKIHEQRYRADQHGAWRKV